MSSCMCVGIQMELTDKLSESFSSIFPAEDAQLTPLLRLGAGACAGIIAMSATYPMDMVRGRLTVQVLFLRFNLLHKDSRKKFLRFFIWLYAKNLLLDVKPLENLLCPYKAVEVNPFANAIQFLLRFFFEMNRNSF